MDHRLTAGVYTPLHRCGSSCQLFWLFLLLALDNPALPLHTINADKYIMNNVKVQITRWNQIGLSVSEILSVIINLSMFYCLNNDKAIRQKFFKIVLSSSCLLTCPSHNQLFWHYLSYFIYVFELLILDNILKYEKKMFCLATYSIIVLFIVKICSNILVIFV